MSEKAGDAMKVTGYKIMLDLINEYPELRGVFAADVSIAQGAAQAVVGNMTNKTGDRINFAAHRRAVGRVDFRSFRLCQLTAISALFAVFVWLDLVTPHILLLFGFLIGVGRALCAPAWQAIVLPT